MSPIKNTFFITGLGRSGTRFLATTLQRSRQYHVMHEWKLKGTRFRDKYLDQFPLYRFWLARYPFPSARKGYGEVNSHLRHVLMPNQIGQEARIPLRAIIERDPRDSIASAMNRPNQTMNDFNKVCDSVIRDYVRLQQILECSKLHYVRFSFEQMTQSLEYLQQIIDWTGISDVQVSKADVVRKVNQNKATWFPRHAEWKQRELDVFKRIVVENEYQEAIKYTK